MGQQRRADPQPSSPVGFDWLPGRAVHLSEPHLVGLVISLTALFTSLLLGVALWPVSPSFWLYPGGMAVLLGIVSVHAYFGILRRHRDYLLRPETSE